MNLLRFNTWLRNVAGAQTIKLTRLREGGTVLTADLRCSLPITAIAELPYMRDVYADASASNMQGMVSRLQVNFYAG